MENFDIEWQILIDPEGWSLLGRLLAAQLAAAWVLMKVVLVVILLLVLVRTLNEAALILLLLLLLLLLWLGGHHRPRGVRQHRLRLISLCSCDWIIKVELHVVALLLGAGDLLYGTAWSHCLVLGKRCIVWYHLLVVLRASLAKHEILVIKLTLLG